MTDVRTAATRIGAALAITAAALASTPAIANADEHTVVYTVTTGLDLPVSLSYLAKDPASKAAFDADPNAYLRSERVTLAAGAPWVFETTLTDTSWAYVRASGAAHYNGTPNPHCEIAIDGQTVTQNGGEIDAFCALKPW